MHAGFGGKTWRKESLGTPSSRCEDNIKIELQETRWKSVDRINLPQDEET